MTHNELRDYVAEALESRAFWEVFVEQHPHPDTQMRADLIAYNLTGRRPEVVVEVKPSISNRRQLESAITQVERYVGHCMVETPRAEILPLVVAESITVAVDKREYMNRALVWDLEMFNEVDRRWDFLDQRETFLHRGPQRIVIPYTWGVVADRGVA